MGQLLTQECLEASLGPEGARSREELRFFRPDLAEALSRSSPAAPYVLFGPLAVYLLYRAFALSFAAEGSAVPLTALLVAAGWLSWTLIEYGLHRFIFHLAPTSDPRRVARFLLHFHHHRTPGARQRLVATPLQAGSLVALLAGINTLFGDSSIALPLLAGQALGYLAYEWSHYCAHHRRPRTQLARHLRRHHLRHHAADSGNYGVSSPLWDWVFGTRLTRGGENDDTRADDQADSRTSGSGDPHRGESRDQGLEFLTAPLAQSIAATARLDDEPPRRPAHPVGVVADQPRSSDQV